MLARVLLLRGDRLGGADQLHLVPDWWPGKREALFNEGQAYRGLDLARRAEAAWKLCVRDDPHHPTPDAYLFGAAEGLLEIYGAEERWDEAGAVLWEVYRQVGPAHHARVLNKWLQTRLVRIEPMSARVEVRLPPAASARSVAR